jgi:tetratricopeptide (TPR) repeat protein
MAETAKQTPPALTRREREVLDALCHPLATDGAFAEPASVREIAKTLFVTEAAVKQHLLRLYDKFEIWDEGGRRRLRLANEAIRRGVFEAMGTAAAPSDPLEGGRQAASMRAWPEAFRALEAADSTAPLAPAELELLGEAAMWTGHPDASVEARTRAYAGYLAAGDLAGAGRTALALVINHIVRLQASIAGGWLAKATRALENQAEGPEHALLAATNALLQSATGQLDAAEESARMAFEIGRRSGDADGMALGLVFQGVVLMHRGRLEEGRVLLDEAMVSAATGELSPFATGVVYCRTICACLDAFDYARALEWADEIRRRETDTSDVGFPGDCRTHRAAIHIVRGEWTEGEEEARLACSETETFDLAHTAAATYVIGEICLRRGDLEAAGDAFHRAVELGHPGQPGMAFLWLARRDVEAAAGSISAALENATGPLARAGLLPARAEIALAAGNVQDALMAAEELDGIAERFGTTALRAAAATARGAAELDRGGAARAAALLRSAGQLWREIGAPYESARARSLLGQALRALGDLDASTIELRASLATFENLHARLDEERTRALMG